MLVDITGKKKEAVELMDKIEADLRANDGRRVDITMFDVPVIKYIIPRKKEAMRELNHFYATVDDMLIAVDEESSMKIILGRLRGKIDIPWFLCRALQLPPEAWLRFSTFNCSITYVVIRPEGLVVARSMGDTGHLNYDQTSFSGYHGLKW